MNRNKKLFNLQLFTGGTAITRSNAEALIPVQESHDIIQGVVEQSAVLQRGRRLANMTAAQYKMPVLDMLQYSGLLYHPLDDLIALLYRDQRGYIVPGNRRPRCSTSSEKLQVKYFLNQVPVSVHTLSSPFLFCFSFLPSKG